MKIWLPMPTKTFVIKENGFERTIIIPQSDDRSYNDYLEEAYDEKTRDELRKKQPKPVARISREDIAGALKEYKASFDRRKQTGNPKYY